MEQVLNFEGLICVFRVVQGEVSRCASRSVLNRTRWRAERLIVIELPIYTDRRRARTAPGWGVGLILTQFDSS